MQINISEDHLQDELKEKSEDVIKILKKKEHNSIIQLDAITFPSSSVQIKDFLSQTRTAVVHKAVFNGQTIVAKVLMDRSLESTVNFLKEIKILCYFNHPNIIKMHGVVRLDGETMLLEYMDCDSLSKVIHNKELDYGFNTIIEWGKQCASALDYLHKYQLIHRDVKPSNLLLSEQYRILKLGDFATITAQELKPNLTVGTYRYMAPEVMISSTYDQSCDIYSFGVTLWELLTRRIPFDDLICEEIVWQVAYGSTTLELITSIPDDTEELNNLLQRCLLKQHDRRPSSAEICLIFEVFSEKFPLLDIAVNSKFSETGAHET